MSNQDKLLSDETLKAKIISLVTEAYDGGYSNGQMRTYNTDDAIDIAVEITDIANTQKRLFAESVIGEDDPRPTNGSIGAASNPGTLESMFYTSRKDLRAEQRARISDE